jgi:ubiquinone/menaquinone biosynthesis C-methylase UbiE
MSNEFSRVKESISAEFDAFSGNYTEDMINCVPYYEDILRSMVMDLPESFAPSRILDLGCGNGNVTALLSERFPDASYTLVDASQEMLSICAERFAGLSLNLVHTYFDDFHFSPDTYDLVAAGFSLHHVDSGTKPVLFKRIYETMQSGGHFVYGDLMISKTDPRHSALIEEWGTFVTSHYPDEEKWIWIMEHYDAFDHPDDFDAQVGWLTDAGFSKATAPWRNGFWVSLQATK